MRACARAAVTSAVLLAVGAATARAQPAGAAPAVLLDVPYIQQSEALCGGAAVAMVMRYWGESGVYAETFAPLVDGTAGGIRGDALLSALRGRGWDALSFRGDAALVQARLARRQPVIALIEDRPGTFHYVVIVAWVSGRVVVHDPARNPFRVLDEQGFTAAWDKSGRWTLLAVPGETMRESTPAPAVTPSALVSASPCARLVQEGVAHAQKGEYPAARRALQAASDLCPADSAPWREMAGVHALERNWRETELHARAAVARDARDEHAWRILATSRFVTGNTAGALDAWNHVGEPLIDLVNVRGLQHTRHSAAAALMGLAPKAVLTPDALAAANRRLDELPAAQGARVTYRPLENGRAAVDAVVMERPRVPASLTALAAMGARVVTDRELRGSVANLTGAGDLLTLSWRWWESRPRIAVSYSAPLSFGGVLRADAFRDVQTYERSPLGGGDAPEGAPALREMRKGGGLSLSYWTTKSMRLEAGAGVDDWDGRGTTFALSASVDRRLAGDRVSLTAGGMALGGGFTAITWNAGAEWRSAVRHEGHVLLSRAGIDAASMHAPLALWPGADVGPARPVLLRAHPLLDDGVVSGDVFGRRVYHGSAEWRRWFRPRLRLVPVGPAVFIDLARAEKRVRPGGAWHADAGAGLRVAVPGTGVLRLDLGRGLRDGNTTLSIGWTK